MERVLYLIIIAIFAFLIYQHFSKRIEGMTDCTLSGFSKKSPEEINNMSVQEKELYECQLNLYNKEKGSPENIKTIIRETKKEIPIVEKIIKQLKKKYDTLKKEYKKFENAKTKRNEAIDGLRKFVDGDSQKAPEDRDKTACGDDKRACEPGPGDCTGDLCDARQTTADRNNISLESPE
tara:strand:- start:354 stop:890 length:537 start_codon:yes stop_codon:yes gene_type:complete